MTMRLAFSIAVHAQPEILIIDEVLAVGDARFQKKCQQKIMEMRNAGCTFLFVSHLGGQVQHFCQRALWLDGGKVRLDGDCETVLATYEEFLRGA
jgi:lipopolysaccharide transport system ATP-binding protein